MRYALGEIGRQRLQALAHARSLYAFDFDGTLARIVRNRRAVRLARPVREQLAELSRWAPTVIISGRSLRDLHTHVGGSVSYLVGNHGVEGTHASDTVMRRARRVCTAWKRQIRSRFAAALRNVQVEVEDKTYSLAFHYRRAPRKRPARETVMEALSQLRPSPRIVRGKLSVNVIPPGAPHKGEALLKLMARLHVQHALFVGDDVTDEDVFGLPDERIMTARIGGKKTSAAQFFLKRQSEVGVLLRFLLAASHGTSRYALAKRMAVG